MIAASLLVAFAFGDPDFTVTTILDGDRPAVVLDLGNETLPDEPGNIQEPNEDLKAKRSDVPVAVQSHSNAPEEKECEQPKTKTYVDCAICYQGLPTGRVSVLRESGESGSSKRSCRHFFHTTCAVDFARRGYDHKCPLCKVSYDEHVELPLIETDPEGWWFTLVDLDEGGTLNEDEVFEVLTACVDIDSTILEKNRKKLFEQWDKDQNGKLDYYEVVSPDGLFDFVTKNIQWPGSYLEHLPQSRPVPDINHDQKAWFDYWDKDNNGKLDREELLSALTETLKISPAENAPLLNLVEFSWDADGDGHIDYNEFISPEGLFDHIKANLKLGSEEKQ